MQAIFVIFKHGLTFYYTFFCSFSFFNFTVIINYVCICFCSKCAKFFYNFPPNSSLSNLITLLFLPTGRGLLPFSCMKPSFNIIRNICKKIVGYNVNNKAISIRVTQFCSVFIFWFNVIIPKFIHNCFTNI